MGILRGYVFQPRSHSPACNLPGSKANILINDSGHACLADFSLLTIVPDQSTIIPTCIGGGTIPWMSPELLDPEKFGLKEVRPTKESDCYALGMVIYEVLSGQTPFAPSQSLAVICKILEGTRPERPHEEGGKPFTDVIWRVLERCWEPQPRDRIGAKAVLPGLEGNTSPVMPPCGVDGALGAAGSGSSAFSPFHFHFEPHANI
jgi:serine/threonine protein kinase